MNYSRLLIYFSFFYNVAPFKGKASIQPIQWESVENKMNQLVVLFSEETASLAPVAACPADSTLDPQGGCVCNKDRCSPPPTCTSPATLVTRGAAGVPGDCCDVVDCVMPTSRSAGKMFL